MAYNCHSRQIALHIPKTDGVFVPKRWSVYLQQTVS